MFFFIISDIYYYHNLICIIIFFCNIGDLLQYGALTPLHLFHFNMGLRLLPRNMAHSTLTEEFTNATITGHLGFVF